MAHIDSPVHSHCICTSRLTCPLSLQWHIQAHLCHITAVAHILTCALSLLWHIQTKEYFIPMAQLTDTTFFHCSGTASHQLSATALLPSPDGSRHPLDVYEFSEEDLRGSPGRRSASRGLWECLIGCRHKVDQQLARRRVNICLHLKIKSFLSFGWQSFILE